ncbi:MAG: class II fructose-bisphosphate aldolase [Eubacteriales bacterium]|nr:class II fructose-bisphosphate aldolase [Eubacteriales bacterium]
MLEKVSTILKMADECNTAVISFICMDYNMAYSVVAAAEKTNTPVLVMLLPEHCEKNNTINVAGFARMVKELAESVKVPVGLHLDHSYDYGSVIQSIKKGFPSVMIDASAYSLEENIALTRKVTETAHILGADVEAEIGHVGLAQDYDGDKRDYYTKADAAERFCRETEVDSLTIAIGNAHGVYVETPHLDIARLEEINAATDVPLVLHGGSGIPHDQLEIAFRKGINKFNVGTEFLGVYYDALAEYVHMLEGDDRPLKMLDVPMFVQERLCGYLEEKLKLSKF